MDIGGTKIAAGVVDDDGTILDTLTVATTAEDPEAIENSVISAVAQLRREHEIGGVGVAAAGFVSPRRDAVLFAPNIAWRDHPLRDRLAKGIDVPIVIENDANAAGWAEYRFGAGQGTSSMIMLTLGTGLGGAVILEGRLLRGSFGAAGELGHIQVVPGGHYCGCGHEGCWEMYCSGTALTKAARNAVIALPDRAAALLELGGGRPKGIKGQHVTKAAQAGDRLAIDLLANLGRWVGAGIATLASVVDPELVVVGGGLAAAAGDLVLDSARQSYVDQLSGLGFRGQLRIEGARFGNDAGLMGAADLARIDVRA